MRALTRRDKSLLVNTQTFWATEGRQILNLVAPMNEGLAIPRPRLPRSFCTQLGVVVERRGGEELTVNR